MYRQSIQIPIAEPSFFYLIMAATCFRRAATVVTHPKTRGALRDIGRVYLNQGQSFLPPITQVQSNQGGALCRLRKNRCHDILDQQECDAIGAKTDKT
jgi:hypothetical protein